MNLPESEGNLRPAEMGAASLGRWAAGRAAFQRKSHRALACVALAAAMFLWTFADAAGQRVAGERRLRREASLVERLGLTDLCLFPEARYTRHLSQADRHSAFQDHPLAFEHFPSGSLVTPPRMIAIPHANLDRKAKIPD